MKNTVNICIPIEYTTSGIKHMELTGPVQVDEGGGYPNKRMKLNLDMWIGHPDPCTPTPPDFSVELDPLTANNLRNAISAALMMLEK
jgi:hypothetical protein